MTVRLDMIQIRFKFCYDSNCFFVYDNQKYFMSRGSFKLRGSIEI